MTQIPQLIRIIKQQLKAQGKTYADVAAALQLSEASVKRLFSEHNFTLERIEAVGKLLGYELTELMQLLADQQQRLSELSQEQEQEIASDLSLLLVTVSVINGYRFDDLLAQYKLSETECIRKLAHLDRLKIIELLPNNRIKLLIAPNFKWLPRGPIQQFFQSKIQHDFFRSDFAKENETLLVLNGMLSQSSIKELQNRLQRLTQEFDRLIEVDRPLELGQKIGITLVLAKRPWDYSVFEPMNKH